MNHTFDDVSKIVGFYRKHQRIPSIEEVEKAWNNVQEDVLKGYVDLLHWRRHCFYAKSEYEVMVMSKIIEYSKIAFNNI